ncbi:MAG TPA: hypothetical protein VN047_11940, partial [Sphingopyxis sp.]|nr:hypothetical protein [Sphingopyxis sp.]
MGEQIVGDRIEEFLRAAGRRGLQRGGTTVARGEAYDAGLRSYMLSVYNYMTSGVLLTGIVALLFSWGGMNS